MSLRAAFGTGSLFGGLERWRPGSSWVRNYWARLVGRGAKEAPTGCRLPCWHRLLVGTPWGERHQAEYASQEQQGATAGSGGGVGEKCQLTCPISDRNPSGIRSSGCHVMPLGATCWTRYTWR
jgi:hypothetical protein